MKKDSESRGGMSRRGLITVGAAGLIGAGGVLARVGLGGSSASAEKSAAAVSLQPTVETFGLADVQSVAFSPDGKLLAAGTTDSSNLALWNVGSWTIDTQIEYSNGDPATALAFSPDGEYVSVVSDGNLQLCDLSQESSQDLGSALGAGFMSCADFSPDGTQLAVGDAAGTVYLVSTADWSLTRSFSSGLDGGVSGLLYASQGKSLIGVGYDGTIRVWSAQQKLLSTFSSGGTVKSMAVTSAGVLCVGSVVGTVSLWDVSTFSRLGSLPSGDSPVTGVAPHPRLDYVATCDTSEKVSLWNMNSKKLALQLDSSDAGLSLAFSPDGRFLVCGHFDGETDVWDGLL